MNPRLARAYRLTRYTAADLAEQSRQGALPPPSSPPDLFRGAARGNTGPVSARDTTDRSSGDCRNIPGLDPGTSNDDWRATVSIGMRSKAMDDLLRRHRAPVGVFLTAWNPRSQRHPIGWNDRMQHALLERLRRQTALPALGAWRGWREEHVLLLTDVRLARRFARVFRQNAVVIVRLGQKTRLLYPLHPTPSLRTLS